MISDFLDLMQDTITMQLVTVRDGFGKPTYGAATSYRARVVYKSMRTTNRFSGQDAVAAGAVWIAGVILPGDIDDKVTLPDGSTPKILYWEEYPDEVGNHHTKLLFGGVSFGGSR